MTLDNVDDDYAVVPYNVVSFVIADDVARITFVFVILCCCSFTLLWPVVCNLY